MFSSKNQNFKQENTFFKLNQHNLLLFIEHIYFHLSTLNSWNKYVTYVQKNVK